MINEMNINAIELTETELDAVAGGAIVVGDVSGFAQDAFNSFFQKDTTVAQRTFAGPEGSGTESVTKISQVGSSAGQFIAIGG